MFSWSPVFPLLESRGHVFLLSPDLSRPEGLLRVYLPIAVNHILTVFEATSSSSMCLRVCVSRQYAPYPLTILMGSCTGPSFVSLALLMWCLHWTVSQRSPVMRVVPVMVSGLIVSVLLLFFSVLSCFWMTSTAVLHSRPIRLPLAFGSRVCFFVGAFAVCLLPSSSPPFTNLIRPVVCLVSSQGWSVQFPLPFWSVSSPGTYFGSLLLVAFGGFLQQLVLVWSTSIKLRKDRTATFELRSVVSRSCGPP